MTICPDPAQDRRLARVRAADLVFRGSIQLRRDRGELAWLSPTSSAKPPRRASPPRSRRCASSSPARMSPRSCCGRRRGRRAAVLAAALQARLRPAGGDQRWSGPDAGRGARVLPRDRSPDRRALGDVGDLRRYHLQPREDQAGHRRPPVPGTEIKLAEDGEVWVKSASVMPGYRSMPEKTAETSSEDGWLLTGDIGELDEDGI